MTVRHLTLRLRRGLWIVFRRGENAITVTCWGVFGEARFFGVSVRVAAFVGSSRSESRILTVSTFLAVFLACPGKAGRT